MKIKKNQKWKSKDSNVILTIIQKSTGNKHWVAITNKGKSHHIHEGTLIKFYELIY